MKKEILKLRGEGKTYLEITEIVGCSKSLVSYYCNAFSKDVIKKGKERRLAGDFKERIMKNTICIECNSELKNNQKKFCSRKCQGDYKHNETYLKIIKGHEDIMYATFRIDYFKNDILKEQDGKCNICEMTTLWNNKPIIFILDHIDGNASNNKRDNLRCICPNCDSQLDTYKSKNKNSARSERYKRPISSIE